MLFLWVLTGSCVGVKKGFIRDTSHLEAQLLLGEISSEVVLEKILAEKEQLHLQAYEIAGELPEAPDALIPASRQNRIYDNLAVHLVHDSMLHAIMRVEKNPRAIEQLIVSAAVYQNSYGSMPKLRRIINRGNTAAGIPRGYLHKSRRFMLSPNIRKSIPPSDLLDPLPQSGALRLLGYNIFRQFDRVSEGSYQTVNLVSGAFGNTIAAIRKNPPVIIDQSGFVSFLEPLDIILMKSEGNFTDKFIPGYFGHTAVWTGDADSLRLMHHAGFQNSAESLFIESVRTGVKFSGIDELSDASVLLVIRVFGLNDDARDLAIERLVSHVGKLYDFNFDLESPSKLFCTEVPYLIFDQINWKAQYSFGRYTMSPDDIIRTAFSDNRLQFMLLITPEQVIHMPAHELIEKLITH